MPTQLANSIYQHLLKKGPMGLHALVADFSSDPLMMRRTLAVLEHEDLIEQTPAAYAPAQVGVRQWKAIDAK